MDAVDVVQAAQAAVPVTAKGAGSISSIATSAGVWVLVLGVITALIKGWPRLLEIGNLRRKDEFDAMGDRIATLEGKLEVERARHEAEVAILRHSVANSNTCLDAILLLLEAAPEKAAEHAAKIRIMRQEMRDREEREKLSFAAAKIAAAGPMA